MSPDRLTAAARIAARDFAPRIDLGAYEALRWSRELDDRPVLALDDVSGIPFLSDIAGVTEYQHRARLRATEGDLFAAATPETVGYGAYCRELLRLGSARFVLADGGDDPVAVADACRLGSAFALIVESARRGGGLVIHPYMGIESVWALGRAVAEASRRPVQVLAPPPPVTWIANDKGSFTELVTAVLGPDWLVESHEAASAGELAGLLRGLARRHRRVALKRRRCASAMGNAVFDRADVERQSRDELEASVASFLTRTEWDGSEPVQAVAWEETDISPSTQIWISPDGDGEPVLEGIFEQILEEERRVFVGSRPSRLPDSVHRQLERGSLAAAAGLQRLGYVGRCSFDFLVVGDPDGEFAVHFTECNGRWGGTSTPMSLMDRLFDGRRPAYRAQDFVSPELTGVEFSEILAALGDDLFDPSTRSGRFVLYNVGPLAEHGKLDVISLGGSQEEAEEGMLEVLPRRLGLG
jgi:hypothetical protein